MRVLYSSVLYFIRVLGGFRLAQYLTRDRLRILCYHGFSIGDEWRTAPYMFMRASTFERRMEILKRRRLPIISLDDAIGRLMRGEVHNAETVITFDDGWMSTITVGLPILRKYGFPVCVYVTTEHLDAGMEVFEVALYHMMSCARTDRLVLEGVHPNLDGSYPLGKDRSATHAAFVRAAEAALPALADRQRVLAPIARALQLDLDDILSNGRFNLVDRAGIRELISCGHDVQLHTHSHRLPDDSFEEMAREIGQNQLCLESIVGSCPRHLCFPSGVYRAHQFEWLERLGILSATTCDPGLNEPGSPLLQLKRYLDSQSTSAILFEAEICGVTDLVRDLRSAIRWLLSTAFGMR